MLMGVNKKNIPEEIGLRIENEEIGRAADLIRGGWVDRLKTTIYRDFLNFITSLSRYTLTVSDFRLESLLGFRFWQRSRPRPWNKTAPFTTARKFSGITL